MGEATNTTTKFIDHIGRKNNTARLIELGTLLTNLNNKKTQLEKVIDVGNLRPEELNEKIREFNNLADTINQSIKERAGLTNKESLIKPVIKKELINPVTEEQPKQKEEVDLQQNERGEHTRVTSGDNLVEDSVVEKNNAYVEEEKEQNIPVIENNKTETEELPTNQSNEELRKQLYEEMQKIVDMEKQLAQLDAENKELEEFIAKQEEGEKLEQLKEKALLAIRAGKKAGLSKKELLEKGFNAGDIDEVFNSKKK